MNTNGLAKHYDTLGPWERLPLITAASARGDQAEKGRLARTAPMVTFRVPNYYGLGAGLRSLAVLHLMMRLDLAALFWEINGTLTEGAALGIEPHNDRLDGAWRLVAFRMGRAAAVWRLLCAELNLDPELLIRGLPGYETVRQTEEMAESPAFTEAEALAFLREGRKAEEPEPRIGSTAEEVAAMREYLADHLAEWS